MPRKGPPRRKTRKRAGAAVTELPTTLPEMPRGAKQVKIRQSSELWSEYRLENGSIVKVRPVVSDVFHIKGHFTPDGEPLYLIRGGMTVTTTSPPRLRKPRGS